MMESLKNESGEHYIFPKRIFKGHLDQHLIAHSDRAVADLNPFKKFKVLIVDDDIDSIMPLNVLFRKFGCQTFHAMDPGGAQKEICSNKVDLIVLDWWLEKVTGAEIIEQAVTILNKYKDLGERFRIDKPKIVTHSSLRANKVQLSSNHYFDYVGHWEKSLCPSDLMEKLSQTLKRV